MSEDTLEVRRYDYAFCVRRVPVDGVKTRLLTMQEAIARNIKLDAENKVGKWEKCVDLYGYGYNEASESHIQLNATLPKEGPEPKGWRRLNDRLCKRIVYQRLIWLMQNDRVLCDLEANLDPYIEAQWCKPTKASRGKLRTFINHLMRDFQLLADKQLAMQLQREVRYEKRRMGGG
jgi:hypothetical protein